MYTISIVLSLLTTIFITYTNNTELSLKVVMLSLLYFAIFVILYIALIFIIAFICSSFINKNKPIKKASKFYNFIFNIINSFLCKTANIKVVVKNKEILKKDKQYVIVCNHKSRFDPMIISNELRKVLKIAFISKQENFDIPIVGGVIHKCGYIGIDREHPKNALNSVNQAVDFIENNKKYSYGVFPEGTRNKGDDLMPFKNGCLKIAQKSKKPICIITLTNTADIHKNFPFKRTYVTMDIVDIIEPEIFDEHTTTEVGNIIREKMINSLKK